MKMNLYNTYLNSAYAIIKRKLVITEYYLLPLEQYSSKSEKTGLTDRERSFVAFICGDVRRC